MIPYTWLISGLIVVAAIAGSYVKGRSDGKAIIISQQAREDQIRFETLQLAQQAAAEEIAKIEVKNVTTRQKLETEIREKPVYRDCVADDRVLGLVNQAITGTEPTGGSVVPGAGSDDRTDVR